MIGLLQRVLNASVEVDGAIIARIGPGLLVLVGVERGDDGAGAERLAERLLGYRVFADEQGKMNLSLLDTGGEMLLVPQFTLAADTHKGSRPGFSTAAEPAHGEALFEQLLGCLRRRLPGVASGQFGAHMAVSLVNDGPVTLSLRVPPHKS